jgi:dihydroorotate dehydrogenase
MYEKLVRPVLFAYSRDDPENAHRLAMGLMHLAQHIPGLLRTIEWWYEAHHNPHPAEICGITFPNRIGLAAGFDKHAEAVLFLQALGFGFLEIGTVLPRLQYGNDRPRLFRLPEHEALINRMGFNSRGAYVVARNLEKMRPQIHIPVIGSVGKMKDTPNEDAAEDYCAAAARIRSFVPMLKVNISSPNTPGLRELQGGKYLENLVHALRRQEFLLACETGITAQPVFVKWAPDITFAEADEMLDACLSGGAAGLTLGNTTTGRPRLEPHSSVVSETGGFSGPQTFNRTMELLSHVRKRNAEIPIIACGGINSPARAREALDRGANLIQVYTAFVYKGPRLVSKLRATV